MSGEKCSDMDRNSFVVPGDDVARLEDQIKAQHTREFIANISKKPTDIINHPKHSHYFRSCPYDSIDIYRVLTIFEVACPVMQHISKKAICGGQRGHKNIRRDLQDIIDSATRKLAMLDEDERVAK